MTRSFKFFPTPYHSLLLWLVWQVLHDFSPGHMLLGAAFAIIIPWLVAPLSAEEPVARKPVKAALYMLNLIRDIIMSNWEVTKRVLRSNKHLQPGFIAVPLDISEPLLLTILANSISLTPGTVSVDFSENKDWLYVHVLHLEDEAALIAELKQRYEQPLKEIFQC